MARSKRSPEAEAFDDIIEKLKKGEMNFLPLNAQLVRIVHCWQYETTSLKEVGRGIYGVVRRISVHGVEVARMELSVSTKGKIKVASAYYYAGGASLKSLRLRRKMKDQVLEYKKEIDKRLEAQGFWLEDSCARGESPAIKEWRRLTGASFRS